MSEHSSKEYIGLPDLNGWAALRAVVERGSVKAAAKVLHIGQPAVSKRLAALEACYNIPLMNRIRGRLRLTEAGEKVYQLAVQAIDQHLELQEELLLSNKDQQSMRLETTAAIGEHLLPNLLVQFKEKFPHYWVDNRMGYGREIQTHLGRGMTDLALMENAPDHVDILTQKWMEDELWLVCGGNHPLAKTKEPLSIDSLPELIYVLREKRASSREDLRMAMERIGIKQLNVSLEMGSTDAIVEILNQGQHVSFMPHFAVIDRIKSGQLVHLEVQGLHIPRTLWISRNRKNLEHPVVEHFIQFMHKSIKPSL
ncbi:MAG: LysR family transcriptional regulator [Magnetococcales bacterium]|nr:LysR family transcriptional regulator [Magnetococcales bacterium]